MLIVNCASASGYAFGFSLLDIFLLMLSVGLLNTRRGRIQFGQLKSAKKVRSKERTNKVIHTKIKRVTRTTCARRKRRRNNWKTNQLLTRMRFRERMREFFTGKKRQHTIIYYLLNTTRKCIIYSLYVIKLHGSHCFSSSSSLLKRRENSSSALECCLFARVFALTILMSLSARTAAFFFL